MDENPTSLRIPDHGVAELFSLSAQWQAWLDVEAALARAQADLGMIPVAVAEEITAKSRLELLDQDRIKDGLRRTGHKLVPLIWELSRVCDDEAAKFVHWAATTQNIVQTGDLLLVRRAHEIILGQMANVLTAMADLAEKGRDMVLPGRTHGQHAVPTTFGLKVAVWIDEICRHVERLQSAEPRIFTAMLGGAAGTMASFGDQGKKVQDSLAAHLNMTSMSMPARTIADHQAEYVCLLGLLAASCSKIGREIYTQMKDEFGEVREPVPAGTVGSSTMPQKRNPILSQDIVAMSAKLRALVPLALEAMQTEHEADRTTSLMMGDALRPACVIMADILARLEILMQGMDLFPDRMRQNLDLSGGLIMAEAVMLSLGEEIGRQDAHDVIYDAAEGAIQGRASFADLLAADEKVRAHLSEQQITELLDPAGYLGWAGDAADDFAARARAVAVAIKPVGR